MLQRMLRRSPMKKPFTAMAWVKFAGQGSYGNAILTISDRENGRSGTGIGFNQGYGSFARFGKSLCRGCSHWTYYQSFKDLWVHQAFAVNPVTGKVLMYREGRLIHSCSNVFPADDMDDFFVVTAAKAAHGDVYDVKIFKDEKELQDFGQRGKMPDLLYLISVTAMAWVHVKSTPGARGSNQKSGCYVRVSYTSDVGEKLSGEHPIFTWNEESHATESKSAVGGGLQPGQGHGIYLNMGNGRCEGGDLDAPEGSWIHVAFAFDFFEMLICIEKTFLGGKGTSQWMLTTGGEPNLRCPNPDTQLLAARAVDSGSAGVHCMYSLSKATPAEKWRQERNRNIDGQKKKNN
eukprot:s1715_g4.t1